jgi:hypothetical protein
MLLPAAGCCWLLLAAAGCWWLMLSADGWCWLLLLLLMLLVVHFTNYLVVLWDCNVIVATHLQLNKNKYDLMVWWSYKLIKFAFDKIAICNHKYLTLLKHIYSKASLMKSCAAAQKLINIYRKPKLQQTKFTANRFYSTSHLQHAEYTANHI